MKDFCKQYHEVTRQLNDNKLCYCQKRIPKHPPEKKMQSSICVCRMSRQDDTEPLDTSTLGFILCRCLQASRKQSSAPSHTSVAGKRRSQQKSSHIDKADEPLRLLRCPAIRMSVRYSSTLTIVQQAAS